MRLSSEVPTLTINSSLEKGHVIQEQRQSLAFAAAIDRESEASSCTSGKEKKGAVRKVSTGAIHQHSLGAPNIDSTSKVGSWWNAQSISLPNPDQIRTVNSLGHSGEPYDSSLGCSPAKSRYSSIDCGHAHSSPPAGRIRKLYSTGEQHSLPNTSRHQHKATLHQDSTDAGVVLEVRSSCQSLTSMSSEKLKEHVSASVLKHESRSSSWREWMTNFKLDYKVKPSTVVDVR